VWYFSWVSIFIPILPSFQPCWFLPTKDTFTPNQVPKLAAQHEGPPAEQAPTLPPVTATVSQLTLEDMSKTCTTQKDTTEDTTEDTENTVICRTCRTCRSALPRFLQQMSLSTWRVILDQYYNYTRFHIQPKLMDEWFWYVDSLGFIHGHLHLCGWQT
jgi:hypothetical protein